MFGQKGSGFGLRTPENRHIYCYRKFGFFGCSQNCWQSKRGTKGGGASRRPPFVARFCATVLSASKKSKFAVTIDMLKKL